MMRKTVRFLLFALVLLTAAMFACAALADTAYFYNPDGGTKLHSDPMCADVSMKYLPLSPVSDDLDTSSYTVCSSCGVSEQAIEMATGTAVPAAADEEIPAPAESTAEPESAAAVSYYYNPDGGTYYHSDPECASVEKKYLPLSSLGTVDPSLLDLKPCPDCVTEPYTAPAATAEPAADDAETADADLPLYLKSLAEKAELLPGVWTMPVDEEITLTEAEELGLDAIRSKYKLTQADTDGYLTAVLHGERPHGDDLLYVYRVVLMKAEEQSDLSSWNAYYEAEVNGETGEILSTRSR